MAYEAAKDYRTASRASEAAPARTASAVVPSNSTDLPRYPRGLYIGVGGDVSLIPVDAPDDSSVVLKAHPNGYLPLAVRRVLATGTTATDIVALF